MSRRIPFYKHVADKKKRRTKVNDYVLVPDYYAIPRVFRVTGIDRTGISVISDDVYAIILNDLASCEILRLPSTKEKREQKLMLMKLEYEA